MTEFHEQSFEDPKVTPFKMKQTERPHLQAKIDEVLTEFENKNPSSDFSKTNLNLVEAESSARKVVAHEEMRRRAAQRAERLEKDALTDPLTGLLNRRGFEKEKKKVINITTRAGGTVDIAAVDLDGLKLVNDSEGHEAGDKLLKKAAETLVQGSREGELVARLGGDEFALVKINIGENYGPWWDRQSQLFSDNNVRASVGIARVDPSDPDKAAQIADEAQYASKLLKGDGRSHLMIADKTGNFEEYLPTQLRQEEPIQLHQEQKEVA